MQILRVRQWGRAGAELVEEALDRAAVGVAQTAGRESEEGPDADLEETAAGVARETLEEVGTEHRRHRGALTAARLAGNTA